MKFFNFIYIVRLLSLAFSILGSFFILFSNDSLLSIISVYFYFNEIFVSLSSQFLEIVSYNSDVVKNWLPFIGIISSVYPWPNSAKGRAKKVWFKLLLKILIPILLYYFGVFSYLVDVINNITLNHSTALRTVAILVTIFPIVVSSLALYFLVLLRIKGVEYFMMEQKIKGKEDNSFVKKKYHKFVKKLILPLARPCQGEGKTNPVVNNDILFDHYSKIFIFWILFYFIMLIIVIIFIINT